MELYMQVLRGDQSIRLSCVCVRLVAIVGNHKARVAPPAGGHNLAQTSRRLHHLRFEWPPSRGADPLTPGTADQPLDRPQPATSGSNKLDCAIR